MKALRRRYGSARRGTRVPMPDMSWLFGGPTGTIHERVAATLGWTVADTQSFSLAMLREMVRDKNPALAEEISRMIQSGRHIVGGSGG